MFVAEGRIAYEGGCRRRVWVVGMGLIATAGYCDVRMLISLNPAKAGAFSPKTRSPSLGRVRREKTRRARYGVFAGFAQLVEFAKGDRLCPI